MMDSNKTTIFWSVTPCSLVNEYLSPPYSESCSISLQRAQFSIGHPITHVKISLSQAEKAVAWLRDFTVGVSLQTPKLNLTPLNVRCVVDKMALALNFL